MALHLVLGTHLVASMIWPCSFPDPLNENDSQKRSEWFLALRVSDQLSRIVDRSCRHPSREAKRVAHMFICVYLC